MRDHLEPKPTICSLCGETFDASKRNRGKGVHRFCSAACRQKADSARQYRRRRTALSPAELQRACVICGISFQTDAAHPKALTCSQKCNQARMNRVRRQTRAKNTDLSERACEECGTLYTPSVMVAHKQKYCSHRCASRVAQRMLQSRRARPSDQNKRLKTAKWKTAAKAAMERDGNKCRSCGASGCRLSVHHKFHLTPAEREDHSLENLVTLCGTCHSGMHDIQLGRQDGQVVITGLVFKLLGITEVKVLRE